MAEFLGHWEAGMLTCVRCSKDGDKQQCLPKEFYARVKEFNGSLEELCKLAEELGLGKMTPIGKNGYPRFSCPDQRRVKLPAGSYFSPLYKRAHNKAGSPVGRSLSFLLFRTGL